MDSNKNISYGSTRGTMHESILFDKKYSSRDATETKATRHHYYEREIISYIVMFFCFSPILIGIYTGGIFIRPLDFIFGLIMINCLAIPAAGMIFPYWWGHIKITNARIIFREEPSIKFNILSTREFIFSPNLVVNFNLKTNRLTFQQGEKNGLLNLDGLSAKDIEEFREILCDVENVDLTLEKGK
jgi:hypothetical protein